MNLGFLYYEGRLVPKDNAEAVKWFRKSADQGNAISQCDLGLCYFKGDGVQKDRVEASKWLRKSADQGNARASKVLASIEGKNRSGNSSRIQRRIPSPRLKDREISQRFGKVFFRQNRRDGAHHGGLLGVAAFLGGNPVMGFRLDRRAARPCSCG